MLILQVRAIYTQRAISSSSSHLFAVGKKLRDSLESCAKYTSNKSSPISLGHSVQALTSDETC